MDLFQKSKADLAFDNAMDSITQLINNTYVKESTKDLQLFRDIRDMLEKSKLMDDWGFRPKSKFK